MSQDPPIRIRVRSTQERAARDPAPLVPASAGPLGGNPARWVPAGDAARVSSQQPVAPVPVGPMNGHEVQAMGALGREANLHARNDDAVKHAWAFVIRVSVISVPVSLFATVALMAFANRPLLSWWTVLVFFGAMGVVFALAYRREMQTSAGGIAYMVADKQIKFYEREQGERFEYWRRVYEDGRQLPPE